MKRTMSIFLALILTLSLSVSTAFGYSSSSVSVSPGNGVAEVDGTSVSLDVPARIINNRTMVPLRFIAENLGYEVSWDGPSKTVRIDGDPEVTLKIGSSQAWLGNESHELDAPPLIEKGRTLVPLRFVGESLGAEVNWDAEKRIASITHSAQLNQARHLYGTAAQKEKEILEALDLDFAFTTALELSQKSNGISDRGFHLMGTVGGKAAAQFAFDTFKEIGLDPQFHTFKGTGWEYYGSDMKIQGHPELDYFITSHPYTPATPEGGITGELVYVGTASKEELAGMDLTGKIVLADFDWDYTLWMNNLEHQVASHGAAGLIFFMSNGYGTAESGQAEFVGDWSGKAATIPTWSMRLGDGQALAALAEKEKLTVTLTSDCETIPNADGYNVIAKLEGSLYPDEYIVLNAHTDAYFNCLQDDSAPVGLMMAMAKAMVDTGYQPDRSILFITTDGEEAGGGETFYDWLVGSWALVNDQVNAWGGKIVNSHTIELISDKESSKFGYRASDPMYLFTRAIADSQNESGAFARPVTVDNYMTTSSDEWAFSYMGAPTTRTIMEDRSGEVYHSTMDNPARFDNKIYGEYIKAHTAFILRLDQQPAAPYDLSRDAQIYLSSLDQEVLESSGISIQPMEALLEEYMDSSLTLLDHNMKIGQLMEKAQAEGKDLTQVQAMLRTYNNKLRTAAATVIQGTQYVALDTPVNQVEYYQYIAPAYKAAADVLKDGRPEDLLDALYALDNDDQGQYTVWYTECMEYDTWYNSYHEALNAEDTRMDVKWVNGRLLKYYDFYKVIESVGEKTAAGSKDFSGEISTLSAFQKDAANRLYNGYQKDMTMWQKALRELPLGDAEAIIDALEQ